MPEKTSTIRLELAGKIEHTNLLPTAFLSEIRVLCSQARRYHFLGVCVTPNRVRDATNYLRGTLTKVVSVAGFPFGISKTGAKLVETKEAIKDGASEIDVVADLARLKAEDYRYVAAEIRRLVRATDSANVALKIIIETSILTPPQMARASRVVEDSGADFVKTNTGFGSRGVRISDVRTIREATGGHMGIKASGGIRDATFALRLLKAGATRLGTSNGPRIIDSVNESEKSHTPQFTQRSNGTESKGGSRRVRIVGNQQM